MPNVINWHLSSSREFAVRQWDDELVVYDCTTGDTHLLDAIASHIFTCLQQAPSTTETLVRLVDSYFVVNKIDELTPEVARILDNLCSLGLIESTPL